MLCNRQVEYNTVFGVFPSLTLTSTKYLMEETQTDDRSELSSLEEASVNSKSRTTGRERAKKAGQARACAECNR